MKNFIQPGNSIQSIAPAGGVVSGVPVVIGSFTGVPGTTAAEGKEFELHLVGVYQLEKATGAWAQGDKIYWDAAAKKATKTTTSNTLFGVAAAAALSGDTTGFVRFGIQA